MGEKMKIGKQRANAGRLTFKREIERELPRHNIRVLRTEECVSKSKCLTEPRAMIEKGTHHGEILEHRS